MTARPPAGRGPGQVSPRLAALLAIPAHRRSHGQLDGDWAAVFPGRSHDFDDLRPYVEGDDVRDIDWSATARNPVPLVKRYVARRDQTVLFLVPTGAELAASGVGGEPKLVAARLVVEVLAGVADARGDRVGLVAGRPDALTVLPSRRGAAHRARVVSSLTAAIDDPPVDVGTVLERAARYQRRRAVVVVVADDVDVDAGLQRAVRRLAIRHDVLWVTLSDVDPTGVEGPLGALGGPRLLPGRARRTARVRAAHLTADRERRRRAVSLLRRNGVSVGRVDGPHDVMAGLHALVREHARARG